jgi:hypothetical protein
MVVALDDRGVCTVNYLGTEPPVLSVASAEKVHSGRMPRPALLRTADHRRTHTHRSSTTWPWTPSTALC